MSDPLLISAALLENLTERMPAVYAYVFLYLRAKANERGQDVFPVTLSGLGSAMGLTRDRTHCALQRLAALNMVKIEPSINGTLVHVLSIEKNVDDSKVIADTKPTPVIQESDTKEPEQLTLESEVTPNDVRKRFDELWERYPRRIGKKEAFRHFQASVISPGQWALINKALDNYAAYVKRKTKPMELIQHGSTWFNNWQDWATYDWQAQDMRGRTVLGTPYVPLEPPAWDMTPEEMKAIREANMKKRPAEPAEDNDLILKLAGGARRQKEPQ